jgi:putative lipoic acid-binding regulatory protein
MTDKSDLAEYPLKVLGINSPSFLNEITTLVKSKATVLSVTESESKNGKYLSITFLIKTPSEKTIDLLFKALTELPSVKLVL